MEDEFIRVLKKIKEIQTGLLKNSPFLKIFDAASQNEVSAFESEVGEVFSTDLTNFLLHNNQGIVADLNYRILSYKEIVTEWRFINQQSSEGKFDGLMEESINNGIDNWAAEDIKRVYWSDKWIPFAKNDNGDFLCVDLDPGKYGDPGQIIHFNPHREGPYTSFLFTYMYSYFELNLKFLMRKQYKLSSRNGLEICSFLKPEVEI